jgi:hypothetical protein
MWMATLPSEETPYQFNAHVCTVPQHTETKGPWEISVKPFGMQPSVAHAPRSRYAFRVERGANLENKKACWLSPAGFPFVTRQRPTVPLPHGSSIIGLGGLNFRVRYGNGCDPSGKATGNVLNYFR